MFIWARCPRCDNTHSISGRSCKRRVTRRLTRAGRHTLCGRCRTWRSLCSLRLRQSWIRSLSHNVIRRGRRSGGSRRTPRYHGQRGKHSSRRVLKRRRDYVFVSCFGDLKKVLNPSPLMYHTSPMGGRCQERGRSHVVWGETVATSFLGRTPIAVCPVAIGVYGRRPYRQGSVFKVNSLWCKTHVVVRVIARGHLVRRGAHA